jgi:hypothetical protein
MIQGREALAQPPLSLAAFTKRERWAERTLSIELVYIQNNPREGNLTETP